MLSYINSSNAIIESFKVAIVGPLTGRYSIYGKELLFAVNQAVSDLNIIPSKIPPIEIIPFDDQCNCDLAKSIAIKITKDQQIKAVIGHICSETTIIASKIYAKQGILHLVPTASNPKITESNISTLFKMCSRDDLQAEYISYFIFKKFNNKKIAILYGQDFYSKELASYIQECLAILKIAPSLYQGVTLENLTKSRQIQSILKKLKKLKIEIIIFSGLYKETASFIRAMYYNKISIPVIISDSNATAGFIESLNSPKIASGVMMSFQQLDRITSNPIELPANNIIKKIGQSGQALFGYTAVEVIKNALEHNVGFFNTRALANWIHNNKIITILGEKSWDTNGDIINPQFAMYLWDDKGKYWPLDF